MNWKGFLFEYLMLTLIGNYHLEQVPFRFETLQNHCNHNCTHDALASVAMNHFYDDDESVYGFMPFSRFRNSNLCSFYALQHVKTVIN